MGPGDEGLSVALTIVLTYRFYSGMVRTTDQETSAIENRV